MCDMDCRIDFNSFRELLELLENTEHNIRLRRSGEGWMDFSRLILLSDSAMIVQDASARKVIMHLRHVVEFEVEKPHMGLTANSTYEVVY